MANTVNFVVKNGLTVGSNVVIAANGTYYGAIANTGVTSGTYGGSSNVAVITVNSAGQITSVSNTSVTATAAIVTNVDTFTGNGSTVAFTLTQTPYNINSTIVNINGATQQKSTYSLSGNIVTLTEAPRSGASIEITTLYNAGGSGTITGALVSTTDTFTGNGSSTAYTLSAIPSNTNYVFVNIDGVQQQRANYSLVGNTLTFTTAPPNTSKIEITSLTSSSGAVIGLNTFGGSNNAVYSSSANTLVAGTLPVTAGGTGVTSSSGANSVVLRDTNQNVVFNNYAPGLTSTSTASGTTTLSVSSSHFQRFTGTLNQTVKLPDETTMPAGQSYVIDNDSTGTITLQDSAGGSLGNIVPGMAGYLYNENNSAATGNWSGYMYVPGAGPGGQITWGTSGLSMGNQTITNSIWNGSTINVAYGGTNNTTYTNGQIIYYDGSKLTSLANSGVTAGSYGNTTTIPSITVDAYGRITAVSNNSVSSTINLSGTSGTGSVSGGGTLTFATNNGITASASGSTITISTPQDVQTSASPTFNNLTVSGNLSVAGAYSYTNTATFQTVDSLIQLAANNTGDIVDIGFYGQYNTSTYAGLVRTGGSNFVLFKGVSAPTSNAFGTITLANTATLKANLTGGMITALANTIGISDGGTNNSSYTTGALLQYNGSGIVSLANTGTAGTYGNSSYVPIITTDVYGRVSGVTNTAISLSASSLSGGTISSTILGNSTVYVGTTAIALNRATASQSLTGVSIDGSAGSATGSAATFTSTTQNSQFNSIGVNTAASGTAGEIRATNNITAGYSDDKLKNKLGNITNALEKLLTLNGFYFEPNQTAIGLGYTPSKQVGVSAQEVQAVLPEIVVPAPIDSNYLTVQYDKIIPLLIEAIKEQQKQIDALTQKVK